MSNRLRSHPYRGLLLASSILPLGVLTFVFLGCIVELYTLLVSRTEAVVYSPDESYGMDPLSGLFRLSCLCILTVNTFLYFRRYLGLAVLPFAVPFCAFLILASTFFERINNYARIDPQGLTDFFHGQSICEITVRSIPVVDYLLLAWMTVLFGWNLVSVINSRRSISLK